MYRPVQSPHWVLHHHGVSVGSQSPLLGTRATVVESGREVHNLFSLSPPPPFWGGPPPPPPDVVPGMFLFGVLVLASLTLRLPWEGMPSLAHYLFITYVLRHMFFFSFLVVGRRFTR